MSNAASVNYSKIKEWISANSDSQKIREELVALGYDEESIKIHLQEFYKEKYGKRQTIAFILMAVGAVLGFIGCLIAILNPFPDLYYFFLYGLTSVSAVIIFVGLYLLFE